MRAVTGVDRAGREQHESRPVPSGERKILELARLNDRTDRRRTAIEYDRLRFDANHFAELTDLHLEIELQVLADLQTDLLGAHGLESRQLGADGVPPGRKEVEHVDAGFVRDRLAGAAGGRRDEFDGDARKHAAARVGDRALERGVAGLRGSRNRAGYRAE